MSDFAFRMSSKDRKMAMGEKISPADDMYDPEGEEYPDPLSSPDSFIQQMLQDINSARRNEEFTPEDIDNLDTFESAVMDFLHTCADPELGEEDLPGTTMIIDILNNQERNNGISTFGGFNPKNPGEIFHPGEIAGSGLNTSDIIDAGISLIPGGGAIKTGLKALAPMVGKGLQAMGLSSALSNVPIVGDLFGGGNDAPTQPIQTMNTVSPGYAPTANNRYEMPFDHITDNLMFESASGIKKKDSDIESLRAQVNAALQQWAKSGEVTENRAVWWALYSYAHEAETVAELASILTAVPEEFHNSVLNSPVGLEEQSPEPGNTGLPEPSEPSGAISPTDTSMSPVPIDGVGTPPKMPQNQSLIPGAIAASHDSLRVKPVFASVDETVFENYAEEDRPILARVSAFINAKTHESDIIDTLYPSYGHEYVIWAIEEAKKVANNDPTVDPSIINLGIEWKEAANDPHDLPEGMHQMNIMEVLEDVEKEKKEKERKNKKFPEKGERVGPNEDEQVNQQATSQMITPQQEKTSDYTSLPNSNLAQAPSPYSAAYNQTMGIAQQLGGDPILTQQTYQSGKDSTPDPGVFGQIQQQQEDEERLQEMYPNVPTDMARQWMQRQEQQQQSQGHPNERQQLRQSPAGQVATQTTSQLPSSTTAKAAAWKDTEGNMLNQGQMYKMTSSDYEIPDLVRIVNNGTKLDLYIPRGDIDVSLSESEIKNSNYKFEPINEKESSFLSESMLSTSEQRALIEENGVARNMDRLNLEGTHYPPLLIQTSKNDSIDLEEIPLQDFFIEDLDLFV